MKGASSAAQRLTMIQCIHEIPLFNFATVLLLLGLVHMQNETDFRIQPSKREFNPIKLHARTRKKNKAIIYLFIYL